ncbi:MAG: F0F1 ATP synthase subunit A [Candidatus Hydrogenedens sp.]|nr:F0F1 ATP synthase subunit A [Candidatus Hydrogenedens sp.]
MEEIGKRWVLYYIPGTDIPIPLGGLHVYTIITSFFVLFLLLIISYWFSHRFQFIPTKTQSLLEIIILWFKSLIEPIIENSNIDILYEILPFVSSLFLFIFFGILLSLIPLPYLEEPTSDLNCTIALALTSLFYSWITALRFRGFHGIIKEFQGPLYSEGIEGQDKTLIQKLSVLFFFPFKIIEEISKIISLSCRLFGNTLGSGIVSIVISTLTFYMFVPILIDVLLTGFEAFIQAFVFASLSTVYISSYFAEH